MILSDFGWEASAQLLLGTYGDNLEEDERRMTFMMTNIDSPGTYIARVIGDLAITFGCVVLQKKIGGRKYYAFHRRMVKTYERNYKKKAPIAMAPYLLIAAENMANRPRRKTWEDIQEAYLEAMQVARQNGGFIFIEAYGYERLAKLAEVRSDGPKAILYLQEALATYTRWGATVKITELTERLAVRR